MSRYLITLAPIDKFFFGGEITFTRSNADDNKKERKLTEAERELKKFDESFSSYVVKSNVFPQQTSLLGMLRFLILSNTKDVFANNRIIKGKENAVSSLIGETSFNLNNNDFSLMKFGKIERISPCFVQRRTENSKWKNLIYAPLDYSLGKISFEQGYSLLDVEKNVIPSIEKYNAKDGLSDLYIEENGIDKLEETDLFKEDPRIGIDRDFKGKTKTGAYYKQIFYRFSNKYKLLKTEEDKNKEDQYAEHDLRFAFYADLDYEFPTDKNFIVSLGGDNSRFTLQAKIVESDTEIKLPEIYSQPKNFDNYCYAKIVLLSDAFIEKEIIRNCLFSINDTVAFRFLTSDVNTQNYYKFSGNNRLQRNDEKYNLYKRGSVFYFADDKQFTTVETALNTKFRFHQIGYNHYKTIKK